MGVTDGRRAGPGTALWLLLAIALSVVALYWSSAYSIGSIWHRSNTFGHGFLVPPIAAWLVWRRRERLASIPLRPSPAWIAVLAGLGFAWLWGRLANVLILEQYAFALLIPASVAAVLGTAVARALAFPLGFLLLGVPAGDFVVPPLVEFTANFAVKALGICGVPVVRSGPFLTLPNGEWTVSDACSGFRYLAASFTLGCLYASLRFRTWRYRLFFVALAIVIPIVANGFRAYMIILLGYLSDMKLAVGVDHYIYGWTLFALFCALLFWIGSRLQEPAVDSTLSSIAPPPRAPDAGARHLLAIGLLALVAVGIWPVYAARIERAGAAVGAAELDLPRLAGGWEEVEDPITLWSPAYSGAALERVRAYRRGDRVVGLYVGYYRHQGPGAELINSMNSIVSLGNREWRRGRERGLTVGLGGRPTPMRETLAIRRNGELLIWHRYWLGGPYTESPFVAQLLELRARLLTGRDDAALIVAFAPSEERRQAAAEDLRAFLDAMGPLLDTTLRRAAESP